MSGKGSKPRPYSVSHETYGERWEAAFRPKVKAGRVGPPSNSPEARRQYMRRYCSSALGRATRAAYRKKFKASMSGRADILIQGAKRRAARDRRDFSLTLDWLMPLLTPLRCMATGERLSLVPGSPNVPSIDRKDSSEGYTPDNCWVVAWHYNQTKGTGDCQ